MIVVLTDPRRPEYLAQTLASVDQSATDSNRIVLVDGPVVAAPSPWRVISAPKPVSSLPKQNRWTTWRAFELAADAQEDLLLFEDDVQGCPNAVLYAETFPVPGDCAFISLYAPWGDASFMPGIWRYHSANFSYCQALKIPLRTCREFADARVEMETSKSGGSDECMREVGGRRDWLVGVHYPGLFQHVGMSSLVSGEGGLFGARHSRAWLTDTDAMRLRRSDLNLYR